MSLLLIVKLAIVLSIFLQVFSLALKARLHDVFYLFRHWRHGLGAILAIFVVVPAIAVFICMEFDLKPATKVAIVALAVSPIPPILPRTQIQAGGSPCYITGLFVLTILASVFLTPAILALVSQLFGTHAFIAPQKLVTILLMTCALPLLAGFVLAPVFGESVPVVSHYAERLGSILLIVGLIVVIVLVAPAMWAVLGDGTLFVLIAMSAAGLLAGYLLGGPEPRDRATLALAGAARHPGVAIAVAVSSFPEETLAPAAIILGTILSTIISSVFVKHLAVSEPTQTGNVGGPRRR